jgi:mono/diheme cytochrome c family protein
MKKRCLRLLGGGLATLVAVAAVAVGAGLLLAQQKMQRRIDLPAREVALRTDAGAVERGRYLYASRGCVDCHGANGAGRVFVEDDSGLRIAGPNITTGPGGVVAGYRPVDWVLSIRHGVSPLGRALMVMPSEDYNRFTDDDLASLVAYVRSLPPTSGNGAVVELPLPVRVLYGFGFIQDAAARIDHAQPPPTPVPESVTLAHGEYVASMCLGCHGAGLAGGRIPGAPPGWPAAANLTPGAGSVMGLYPEADSMIAMFRTGRRPDGSTVEVMPFESLRELNDTDLRALHLYLRSLPPRPHG